MSALFELAAAFAQVGICAFGGGLSSLPLIEYQIVTKTGWLTPEAFAQVLALSQVTPGPIAINAATFVGYQQAGFLGSLTATFFLTAAPICALSLVLLLLKRASAENSKKFKTLLRPVVAGLLSLSLISPLTSTWNNGLLASAMLAAGIISLQKVKILRENPPILLFLFGVIGIFFL